MSTRVKDMTTALARALQVEREGVTYFERAHALVSDPRVRGVFEKLANAKKEQLRSLEEGLEGLDLPTRAATPDEGRTPVYPLAELEKVECYVCGYGADVNKIPDSCPRCGSSRYAFAKEISLKRAWQIAEGGSTVSIKALGDAEKEADAKVKPVLSKQIQLEQQLLDEARRELEEARRD